MWCVYVYVYIYPILHGDLYMCRNGMQSLRSKAALHRNHQLKNLFGLDCYSGSKASLNTGSYKDCGHTTDHVHAINETAMTFKFHFACVQKCRGICGEGGWRCTYSFYTLTKFCLHTYVDTHKFPFLKMVYGLLYTAPLSVCKHTRPIYCPTHFHLFITVYLCTAIIVNKQWQALCRSTKTIYICIAFISINGHNH